jgi:hypothetical protein
MLMFDVRNAISTILDRYTLADIVEITLRKYRRDKVTPPFLSRSVPLAAVFAEKPEPLRSKRRVAARNHFSGARGIPTKQHPQNPAAN